MRICLRGCVRLRRKSRVLKNTGGEGKSSSMLDVEVVRELLIENSAGSAG